MFAAHLPQEGTDNNLGSEGVGGEGGREGERILKQKKSRMQCGVKRENV